ncbi:acyltransferase family protein [Phytohabitans suffuscus]|uniref:Acyltransferase 3 domain-containing protein n=1 Tax=Phytohabitans suffuscus TaxID=624315 RepID=A0A6F8YVH4_9ACTN|nr:acyltransferase [Phytohabitans suffuscus]BCB90056.1 hypothetical protein Psuf_073690 [Phytohabitans suffuscus]
MWGSRELADRTPASRERYVDLLRVLSIVTVVLGHWLISVITYDHRGQLTGRSALDSLSWAFPITWLVQVVPVFFVVGGYANAASLASHRRRGGVAVTWLQDRGGRLVPPTTVLLAVFAAGAGIARLLGTDPALVRHAVWAASIPLWFLGAYLIVVVLAPLMYRLHRRFGWWALAALVVLVGLGDLARFHGMASLGSGSYVFGWLAIHQVGFFWRDGRLGFRPRVWACVLAGGLAAVVLLTVPGPYPVSMIDVAGQEPHNASPPTLALLATTTFQLGLVLTLRGPAERWLHRRRPWGGVTALNGVVFTIFLWHMSAVLLVVGALLALHRLPTPTVATPAWWLWRLPWLAMCLVALAVLVAVFGSVEARGRRRGRGSAGRPSGLAVALTGPVSGVPLTVAAYAAVTAGLLQNNLAPQSGHYALGVPAAALVTYAVGAGLLRALRALPVPSTP